MGGSRKPFPLFGHEVGGCRDLWASEVPGPDLAVTCNGDSTQPFSIFLDPRAPGEGSAGAARGGGLRGHPDTAGDLAGWHQLQWRSALHHRCPEEHDRDLPQGLLQPHARGRAGGSQGQLQRGDTWGNCQKNQPRTQPEIKTPMLSVGWAVTTIVSLKHDHTLNPGLVIGWFLFQVMY